VPYVALVCVPPLNYPLSIARRACACAGIRMYVYALDARCATRLCLLSTLCFSNWRFRMAPDRALLRISPPASLQQPSYIYLYLCMHVCKDSAAPAHARTRAHRPAAPRQSSGVSQTPHHVTSHGLSAGRHSTQTTTSPIYNI